MADIKRQAAENTKEMDKFQTKKKSPEIFLKALFPLVDDRRMEVIHY